MIDRIFPVLLLLAGTAVFFAACDTVGTTSEDTAEDTTEEAPDDTVSADVINHYAGPGSRLDIKLKENDTAVFTYRDAPEGEVKQTVWATYDPLPNGFLTITVDSAEGTDAPAPGDQAYALDIPGLAFMLHVPGAESEMHVMVSTGACPDGAMDGNWITVKDTKNVSATAPDVPFFGTFYFDPATQVADLPSSFTLADFSAQEGTEPADGATCTDGVISLQETEVYVTDSGVMTARIGEEESDRFIFGVPNEQTDGLSALDGDYSGFRFINHEDAERKIAPVRVSCEGGACTGTDITDIEAGTEASDGSATLSLNEPNSPEAGMITGTITHDAEQETTDDEQVSNIACAASTEVLETDRKLLSCVGMSPDHPEVMFSVLLTSLP